jgi:hypothetical protein
MALHLFSITVDRIPFVPGNCTARLHSFEMKIA